MSKISRIAICVALFIAAIGGALVLSARPTQAARPPGPRCECADIDAPVICKGGKVYPNPCVASCFQATGCVPYGG
jgi:hypothetical protein